MQSATSEMMWFPSSTNKLPEAEQSLTRAGHCSLFRLLFLNYKYSIVNSRSESGIYSESGAFIEKSIFLVEADKYESVLVHLFHQSAETDSLCVFLCHHSMDLGGYVHG